MGNVLQPRVRDLLAVTQVQAGELREVGNVLQPHVRDLLAVPQVQADFPVNWFVSEAMLFFCLNLRNGISTKDICMLSCIQGHSYTLPSIVVHLLSTTCSLNILIYTCYVHCTEIKRKKRTMGLARASVGLGGLARPAATIA